MSAGLISRRELPQWVRPFADLPSRFSVFHGTLPGIEQGKGYQRAVPGRITEYTFIVDRDGKVRFEAETHHAPLRTPRTDTTPVSHIPPAVLIAAGVEALRRTGVRP